MRDGGREGGERMREGGKDEGTSGTSSTAILTKADHRTGSTSPAST